MDGRSEIVDGRNGNRRENDDFMISLPNSDSAVDHEAINEHLAYNNDRADARIDTFPVEDFVGESPLTSCRNETKDDLTNSRKYFRVLSEPSIGFGTFTSSVVKRFASTTELRTRLSSPKGLLIATEPPKSGDSYRRRSNTDISSMKVMASLGITCDRSRNNDNLSFSDSRKYLNLSDRTFRKEIPMFSMLSSFDCSELFWASCKRPIILQERETIFVCQSLKQTEEKESILHELETVKYERYQLKKENERLQEELDNRNKVIDHLIDYMKSNITGEMQNFEDIGDFKKSSPNTSKI